MSSSSFSIGKFESIMRTSIKWIFNFFDDYKATILYINLKIKIILFGFYRDFLIQIIDQ